MGPALRSRINTDPSTPWRCKGEGASGRQELRAAPGASAHLSAGPCAELDRGPRCALDPAGTESAVQLKEVCVRQITTEVPPFPQPRLHLQPPVPATRHSMRVACLPSRPRRPSRRSALPPQPSRPRLLLAFWFPPGQPVLLVPLP